MIAVSGNINNATIEDIKKAGFDQYFLIPLSIDDI